MVIMYLSISFLVFQCIFFGPVFDVIHLCSQEVPSHIRRGRIFPLVTEIVPLDDQWLSMINISCSLAYSFSGIGSSRFVIWNLIFSIFQPISILQTCIWNGIFTLLAKRRDLSGQRCVAWEVHDNKIGQGVTWQIWLARRKFSRIHPVDLIWSEKSIRHRQFGW